MSDNKSCYRLYAGHGNWINLSAKTTQDLLQISKDGIPCRYPLSPGLSIDIIPNDVDCNSKNINMSGLMRADLVYENQSDENHVQQLMSHYIRNLLDEQGIIDAFPPPRTGEDLPIVTSIPTHRHLSLVPSVVGAVRRGPKPNSYKKSNNATAANSSSSSSSAIPGSSLVSSVSSSSASSPSRNRKRSYTLPSRRNNLSSKRNHSSSELSISKREAREQVMSSSNSTTMISNTEVNHVPLFDHSQAHYLDMNSTSNNNNERQQQEEYHQHYAMLPIYQQQQQQQQQHQQEHLWSFQPQNSSATRSTAHLFNFEFNMDIDQQQQEAQQQGNHEVEEEERRKRQSPTDILQEYEFSQRGFDTGGELYANSILEENHHHHLPNSTSDSTDSYAPTSPTTTWTTSQYKKTSKSTTETTASPNTATEPHFFKNTKDLEQVTTLPMERLLLSNNSGNNNNNGNLILSHVGGGGDSS